MAMKFQRQFEAFLLSGGADTTPPVLGLVRRQHALKLRLACLPALGQLCGGRMVKCARFVRSGSVLTHLTGGTFGG
jgi:hypothetical protein